MVYPLENNWLGLIAPCSILLGLLLELAGLWTKKASFLLCGLLFSIPAAFYERDLTLIVGNILACLFIWLLYIKN